MTKRVASTVVPRLRFPEFRNAPEWEVHALSRYIASLDAGVSVNSGDRSALGHEVGVLKTSCVTNGVFESTENKVVQEYGEIARVKEPVRANTIIISRMNTAALVGANAFVDNDIPNLFLPDRLWAAKATAHGHMRFLGYVLGSERGRASISGLAAGSSGTMKNIGKSEVLALQIQAPSFEEQERIAACLTSLDEVIAAQRQKVEALTTHKRGLMQQLFPCEGETRPRLRFPEFRDAPEWEEKVAGKLFANRKEDGEEGLPIHSVTISDGMVPRASFERDFYDIEDSAGNKKVCKGDIAYNMMRMWQGAQGVAVQDCMVSPAYVVLSPLRGVCSNFFAYLFKLPQSLDLLTAYSRGLTKDRLRLYFEDFARMLLRVPSHDEQRRIADCLFSLDTKITAESHKLAALKTHKQGLMQQLFPAPKSTGA